MPSLDRLGCEVLSPFDALLPRRMVFGWGRRRELARVAARQGERLFVVCGSRTLQQSLLWNELLSDFDSQKLRVVELPLVTREPLVEDVDQAVRCLRDNLAGPGDVVVAIGGGSALDVGKAVAGLATQAGEASVREYLEGVGSGLLIASPTLPFIAVPTTGGTGSEATKNAVISQRQPAFKKSLRSDLLLAQTVLIDPELGYTVSRNTTIWSGLDALTQCLESAISCRSTPFTRMLAMEGFRWGWGAIRRVAADGNDRAGREQMALAALYSGIALANSGLGIAHGVAAALGICLDVPHGLACAVLLPTAIACNRDVAQQPLAELARACGAATGDLADDDCVQRLLDQVLALGDDLGVPRRLRDVGVTAAHLNDLVRLSPGNSLNGNPRPVGAVELRALLESIL